MTAAFDFTGFPILETERLHLRDVTPGDAAALFALRSDYDATRLNFGAAYTTPSQGEDLAAHIRRQWRDRREIWWGLTLRENAPTELIGLCILYGLDPANRTATLGYELRRDCWGLGLMHEAASAVLAWGFAHLPLRQVYADTDARNERSRHLLLQLGFEPSGVRVGGRWSEGRAWDLLLFTRTADAMPCGYPR